MNSLDELKTRICYDVPDGALLCAPVPGRGRYVVITTFERDLFVRLAEQERQRIQSEAGIEFMGAALGAAAKSQFK